MRRRSGLTQEDVARHLNVTRGAVGHWERGKNQPPYDVLVKIARLYNTSTAYLVGEIDDPAPLMNVSTEQGASEERTEPPGWEQLTDEERRLVLRVTKAVEKALVTHLLQQREGNVPIRKLKENPEVDELK